MQSREPVQRPRTRRAFVWTGNTDREHAARNSSLAGKAERSTTAFFICSTGCSDMLDWDDFPLRSRRQLFGVPRDGVRHHATKDIVRLPTATRRREPHESPSRLGLTDTRLTFQASATHRANSDPPRRHSPLWRRWLSIRRLARWLRKLPAGPPRPCAFRRHAAAQVIVFEYRITSGRRE